MEAVKDAIQEIDSAKIIRQQVLELLDGDDDVDTLRDTMEGETDLIGVIEALVASITDDNAMITAIDDQRQRLDTRKHRIKTRVETKRALIYQAMSLGEIRKHEAPTATISRKITPGKLMIDDESRVPADWWKPQDPKLDRAGIAKAIKDGASVPGCHLTEATETIQIREA